MNKVIFTLTLSLFVTASLLSWQRESQNTSESFFGQKPPGMIPELFAPGILSTDGNEFNSAFSPDGTQLFFTVVKEENEFIWMMEFADGKWGERRMAPFSGRHRDVDPFITPDGKRLYFSSNRSSAGIGKNEDCDFWYVDKNDDGSWGTPQHLDAPATPGKHDFYFNISRSGTIYYSIFNKDDVGDIFKVRKINGILQSPEPLGPEINTKYNEHDPCIAPDESYLIFSSNKPGGYGSNDLYICFKKSSGFWAAPINMGREINSERYEFCPTFSHDVKYFFFSSSRRGNIDVYWVDAKIINKYKPTH